eukprot:gb/GECH01014799.1/.p1 GENE.gb/GECH01014799.1/~~gb/GECH01014799.1/.p1  ORF type:complete len:278 (+),score=65.46 gb/GECH01014799.1/:1-834(+)
MAQSTNNVDKVIPNPMDALTQDQEQCYHRLRATIEKMNLTEEDKEFCSPLCYYRFLKGYQWNIAKAEEKLKSTIEWRRSYQPKNIKYEEIEDIAKAKLGYVHGLDKEGRPVLYFNFGNDPLSNTRENVAHKMRFMVYMLELATSRMPPNVYNTTWVVDMDHSNVSFSTFKAFKDLIIELSEYYSEILGAAIVIHCGRTIQMTWNCIKPFLADTTVRKYSICRKKKTVAEKLRIHIDEGQLSSLVGGSAEFNFDAFLSQLKQQQTPYGGVTHNNGEAD